MYKDKAKQKEADKRASQRRRDKSKGMTNEGMTVSSSDTRVIPDKSNCKYCGKQLEFAAIECCNDCAEMRSNPVSPATDGHTLASRPALEFTGKLTVMERLFYQPASEFRPGETNFVSLPGRACYNVFKRK